MRVVWICVCCFFFFKQKTAYEMRISDWSSDVCSSDLPGERRMAEHGGRHAGIVDRARIVPEQRIGKGMPLPDRHRRQLHPVGDVAHRIDALATGAAIVIDLDRALVAEFDSGIFQPQRSEEHTSELQSLMRISYAVFCLKKKKTNTENT